jgi:hypothetical protein
MFIQITIIIKRLYAVITTSLLEYKATIVIVIIIIDSDEFLRV